MIHLSASARSGLILAIILVFCLFSLMMARNVEKLYDRTMSPERAMSRLRIANQYIGGLLLIISGFFIGILVMPFFKSLGNIGAAAGIFASFVLFILILLMMQLIYYKPMKKIRKTTETASEQLGNTLRILIITFLPMIAIYTVYSLLPENIKDKAFSNVFGVVIFMLIICCINFIMPLFYKFMFKAVPMEKSELWEVLSAFLSKAGLKNTYLYIWPTKKNKTANALVSGFGKKNIFISDYLIENADEKEIEAIVGHEIGHIKKHHILIRMLVTLVPIPVFSLIGSLMDSYEKNNHTEIPVIPGLIVFMVIFIIYYGVVFHYITRTQERQADDYVLKLGVDPNVYISSLIKLSKLNHMNMKMNKLDEKFQTHPSFARRIRWIEGAAGIRYETMTQD